MNKHTKIKVLLLLIGIQNVAAKGFSPHMVTFFFKNYPKIEKNSFKKVPLKNNPRAGIVVSYFGFMTTSEKSGEVMFPRRHQKPEFSLLVCDNPQPVFMLENTIHHWQVREKAKYAFYSVKQKQDPNTKLFFWDVKKANLPADKHLSVHTMVIFADPDNVYIPEGITVTNNNPQLFLPSIYAKSNSSAAKNALAALEIRAFFDPINRVYNIKKAEESSKESNTKSEAVVQQHIG